MSGLRKIFIIFIVAIVLATTSNIFLGGATATDDSTANTANESTQDTNTNTNTDSNTNVSTENNTTENTVTDNNTTNTTDTNTNINTNTSTKNEVDLSQIRNTLPKTGSNYPLKNILLAVIFVALVVLGFVFIYNKKVGMTDETK